MRTNEQEVKARAAMIAVLLVAASEAWAQERRIIVSIPDRMAALVEQENVVKMYRVAVGAPGSPSPTGEFKIANRVPHPTWYTPGLVVPPGKDNPLGTRWIGLTRKGYGIHGTNNPRSIGKRASHGCIRMRNRDVEELFDQVSEGDVVELHGERDERVAQIFSALAAGATEGQ